MSLSGKRVLVTGADGFIGSHLVQHLVKEGAKVRCFCCYNSFNSFGWIDSIDVETRSGLDLVLGDIRDSNCVYAAMQDCEVVFHLAALISIQFSYVSPDSYVDTNIKGTLNVLQAARALKTPRVVVTSTSEVYGSAQFVPISESHPLQAQSPYAASKIAADQLALSFHKSFSVPVVVLRPFNTYGPRQSTRAVIPTVITQILSGNSTVTVGAVSPTRDFSFVADTVHGFICAATCEESFVGTVVNVGSGFEISIGDTIDLIARIIGREINVVSTSERIRPDKSEVQRLFADISLAKTKFRYAPSYAGLNGFENGLIKTIEWFRDPSNLARYSSDRYAV